MQVIEARVGETDRERLEAYIAERYRHSFGVRPPVFAPLLIAVTNDAGRLLAACGLRAASDGFFSEQYVNGPIEQVAGVALGREIERRRLFEITTMAASSGTGLRRLVQSAVAFGRRQRCRACLFTATAELRRLLGRHDVELRALAPARPERVADADAWGHYYEHDPWVYVTDQPPWEQPAIRQRMREERAVA
jgi:hypothetical protein